MLSTPYRNGTPLAAHITLPEPGPYKLQIVGGGANGALNLYANGKLAASLPHLVVTHPGQSKQTFEAGTVTLPQGDNLITLDTGPLYAKWSDGTEALWTTPALGTGLTIRNADITFAEDYNRMWPDTWSGQKKIYFFSWDGTTRTWKLPQDWSTTKKATLYPLTPEGRGQPIHLAIKDRTLTPRLLPQIPYILIPN
jgi:hypothetical protein